LIVRSEEEIGLHHRGDADDLDLEVRATVAVHIAAQDAAGEAEFAGDIAEGVAADEFESLVAARGGICVDVAKIETVVLAAVEGLDDVTLRAPSRSRGSS
jgi:hypothetical protein